MKKGIDKLLFFCGLIVFVFFLLFLYGGIFIRSYLLAFSLVALFLTISLWWPCFKETKIKKAKKRRRLLRKEFQWYLDNQNKLLKKYNGKFVVIKNCKVLNAYDSELEAIRKTTKEHKLGTFIVQKCTPGDKDYTRTYHSRVGFCKK